MSRRARHIIGPGGPWPANVTLAEVEMSLVHDRYYEHRHEEVVRWLELAEVRLSRLLLNNLMLVRYFGADPPPRVPVFVLRAGEYELQFVERA